MDYLDTIQKYMDGKKYASNNISSSDNKIGYVTETGVSKQYASMDVYNATAGKNNCPSDFIKIVPTWSDLGFPIGSLMTSGQSCGNETKYVQASPPENDFDWEYYIETYEPEDVTTKQEAIDHWNSTGKTNGFLPNANIMTFMSKLGKVGYIDADTQYHDVPVTAKSSYKSFPNISNVTGSNMTDCSSDTPSLKYGEAIVLTNGNQTGYLTTSSVLQFGTNKTNMFLRPPPGEDQMGKAIKYGDFVCISSSSSSYTTQCGWWGCRVAYVNTSTNPNQMEFGPGGDFTTTFKINPPKGSNYNLGGEIKYGYPFTFMTVTAAVSTVNSLSSSNQSSLTPGKSITSENGAYKFIYETDGNVVLYSIIDGSVDVVWSSNTNHTPNYLKMQSDGNLVAYNSSGNQKWATGTNGKGVGPYTLKVQNNRNVVIVDSNDDVQWETRTNITTIVDNGSKYAYVSNNVVKFGSWDASQNKNEFSVEYTATTPTCNISELKETCTGDCIGFIHSPNSNTWQKITPTSTYEIASTVQDIYLKEYDVNLNDSSCNKSDVQFIDPTLFSNYPQGEDFTADGKNQCKVLAPIPIPTYKAETTRTTTYTPITGTLQDQYEDTTDIMKTKTEEYNTLQQQIKIVPPTTTLEQQYKDMSLFDKQHKMQLILWTILSVSILAIVLIRK